MPGNITNAEISVKFLKGYKLIKNIANVARGSRFKNPKELTHHVPELVEGHDEAGAYAPQSFKGPDVNFNPDSLLNTSVQLPQRTAFTY